MPAGFSNVTVANMALSEAGSKSTITSLDPPETRNNRPAGIVNVWYEPARISLLELHNWSFARACVSLSASSVAAPTKRWAFRYQFPANCIQPRFIENPLGPDADAIPFEVEEGSDDVKTILTDQEDVSLIFTRNHTSVEAWSMHFTLMMALQLGLFIGPELHAKQSRLDRMTRRLQTMLLQAPTVDGRGEVKKQERDAVWIRARNA